ncbi:MAG: hypothetical protein JSW50_12295 [Candidatus Latescibacterota bacterium]|nr:MAG: hypothetical protein JSW50_12295 [Candidatus Latescibacterota bacterium]
MKDLILTSFLEQQEIEAMELDRDSDIVHIEPIGPRPTQKYLVEYRCKGLVRTRKGVEEAKKFCVGFYFPPDYLHRVVGYEVVTLLWPAGCWHSNVRFPYICPGRLAPGTPLVDLILQVYAIITFNNITIQENEAMRPEASAWARRNMHRFPLENRPLRRRKVELQIKDGPELTDDRDKQQKGENAG